MTEAGDIDGRFIPTHARAVAGVELDGERVLYHEELQTVCVLNPTATVVWNCLDGSSDLDRLCLDLAEVFLVEAEVIREDVLGIVQEFGRQGLLKGVEPDAEEVAAHTLAAPDALDHDLD